MSLSEAGTGSDLRNAESVLLREVRNVSQWTTAPSVMEQVYYVTSSGAVRCRTRTAAASTCLVDFQPHYIHMRHPPHLTFITVSTRCVFIILPCIKRLPHAKSTACSRFLSATSRQPIGYGSVPCLDTQTCIIMQMPAHAQLPSPQSAGQRNLTSCLRAPHTVQD